MTDLIEKDATELIRGLSSGDFSCAELMAVTLDRIEAVNPKINAIVSLRPRDDLMAEAKAADSAKNRGPLHGLPIAIKDLEDTKGLLTTYGSPIFAQHVPDADGLAAGRIRNAGAIIIGKTNTPEFGLGSQSYNPVHGVTRNPFDTTKTSGGSSGGAAAALSTRMLAIADGSDMMGSLRNPAAFCNVYGFRPTFGLVPAGTGKETFLHMLATLGPMGRTVKDMALLLDVMAGPEPGNPHSLPQQPSFLDALSAPPETARIGWIGDWDGHYPIENEILDLSQAGLKVFESLGHRIEPITPDFDPNRLWKAWTALRSMHMAIELGILYDNPSHKEQLKPELVYEIEQGRALTLTDIKEASLIRSHWFAHLAKLFETYDALVLPSAQVFPFDADTHWPQTVNNTQMTTYHQWMEIVIPAGLVGLPAVNVPVGFGKNGLPMGMQLIGKRGSDAGILRLAQSYHEATDWPGRKLPTVGGALR